MSKTLVLITGYARAGKDTLADGILEWSQRPALRINFADSLKEAADNFLSYLNLSDVSFFDETFKCEHRDSLVCMGELARSVDRDVFARHLAYWVPMCADANDRSAETIVCADWRYLNELEVVKKHLEPKGWTIRKVYIETEGVLPANDVEAASIYTIRMTVGFDYVLLFRPESRRLILDAGRSMAAKWQL